MNAYINDAVIVMERIRRSDTYCGALVLTLTVDYPKVSLSCGRGAARRINARIRAQVDCFCRYVRNFLYPQAVNSYRSAKESGYPFHPFDANLQYQITYNDNCVLSLYRDQYEYVGGAHGNTIRSSDTWSLRTGCAGSLDCLLKAAGIGKEQLLKMIITQADEHMAENPGIYFEDYQTLIKTYFNPQSFYLTPEGVAVYYQQYQIAPYASGIIVFTIPYEAVGYQPSCGCI